MCEELSQSYFFFYLSELQFDLLKLSASCALGWFKRLCQSVCFCLHTQTPQAWMSVWNRLSLSPTRAANMSEFFCMRAHTHQNLHLRVFWSGLIFPSIPFPWREEWREAGVVIWGIDHRQMSWWGLLGAEVREQVEVWILLFWGRKKAKPARCRSIFTPMATALEREDGDGLITSSISHNRLKWECTELSGVPCTRISGLMSSYVLRYQNVASYHNQCI